MALSLPRHTKHRYERRSEKGNAKGLKREKFTLYRILLEDDLLNSLLAYIPQPKNGKKTNTVVF